MKKKIANINFTSQYFNINNNSLIFLFGANNTGKTLFLDLFSTQLIADNLVRTVNKSFLNYMICYKKANIVPKFMDTVGEFIKDKFEEKILNEELFIKYYSKLEIDKILNVKINLLSENQIQKLLIFYQFSNIFFDIYLIDLPNNIDNKIKEELINFSYEFIKLYGKIVFITEDKLELLTHYPDEYVIYFDKVSKNRIFTHNIQNINIFLQSF